MGPNESMNMSILNDSKMLNETIDMKNLGVVDDINLQKSIKKPSYAQMFNEDAKSNPELVGFLFKVGCEVGSYYG